VGDDRREPKPGLTDSARCVAGIERLGLTSRTTVIATADHGMSQQALNRKIFIDDYVDPRRWT
jgi:predicted AlkP superfamily pyrophosphatase or phosphodiesterase